MPQIMLTCPNCRYESPAHHFIRLDNNLLKCRRCRGSFADPDSFKSDASYADTDSDKVVSRFPFALNGLNAFIKVPDGYLAYASGIGGQMEIFGNGIHRIEGTSAKLQVYYICLNPRILWGSSGIKGFGVHGTAQMSLSEAYVKNRLANDPHSLYTFENTLKTMLCNHINAYLKDKSQQRGTAMFTQPGGYDGALGEIENGVHLMHIYPQGYIDANHAVSMVNSVSDYSAPGGESITPERIQIPVTIERLPERPYVIAKGTEEVFIYGQNKYKRHKSGERIETESLRDIKHLIRYNTKEFSFPYGWGIYKQLCAPEGTYSANGTITFYIDDACKVGTLVAQSGSFERFAEQFFNDVFRKELAEKLKPLMSHMIARRDFDVKRISSSLSALSVLLTDALNGENSSTAQNAFTRYGLRVSRLDILDIHFYGSGDKDV